MSAKTETPGRGARQLLVDSVIFAMAVAVGGITVAGLLDDPAAAHTWIFRADLATGVAGCLALWWRRRFPVVLGVALAVASAYSETVAAASVATLFTVAVHRSNRATATVCAISLAAVTSYQLWWPETAAPLMVFAVIGMGHLATVAWGLSVRNRRALLASLRERAAAAEVEASLRAERAEREAREALAREMHDVLGHRLSLLSVHAGALTYYPDAPAADRVRAAEVVRENAHRALQDLREVIGVLRAPVGELPLPGLGDVPELIEEARQAGAPVELEDEDGLTTGGREVPETQGRTLYRLVQEGLTNARKHAPGACVVVRMAGRPGGRLSAEVVNEAPPGPPPTGSAERTAGSGQGLHGLGERARLVAGQLDHGPTESGGWRVGVRLPWPS